MCKAWAEQFNYGKEEGREEGLEEGGNKMIYNLVADGDLSPEKGAKRLSITVDELRKRMELCGKKFPEKELV